MNIIMKRKIFKFYSICKKFRSYVSYVFTDLLVVGLLELSIRCSINPNKKRRWHNLPGELVVSLTSYPPRFNKLHLTLECLLNQSIKPDHIVLWIAKNDRKHLKPSILKLEKRGLKIEYCDDIGSFKKIIPALKQYSNCFVVTADDDLYYWPTWLEELVKERNNDENEIVCHRAHRILKGNDGIPLPYSTWEFESTHSFANPDLFPTSGGGVLYPPGCFYADVSDVNTFQELTPKSDDIWLYWMMRMQGYKARKIASRPRMYSWLSTQKVALWRTNLLCGDNDKQIKAMILRYGFPC